MSTTKYQVFISSTYEDLKEERDEIIKAVLEMGHIPVGMEMFSAADEEQWKLITRQIDQTDYYVVIVAHRYGSVIGKKSYTEKEYEYAVKQKIPVLGFIIEDSASWPSDRIESDSDRTKALKLFKQKIKRKLVSFWSTKEDLGGKVSRSLIKLITTNPRPGWIRTSETVGPEVVSEMSRLSSENARLNDENEQIKKRLEEYLRIDSSPFSQGQDQIDIEFIYKIDANKYEDKINIDWDSLFLEISKGILENTAEYYVKRVLSTMIFSRIEYKISALQIKEEDFLKIKTQFIALGYIDIQIVTVPGLTDGSFAAKRGSQHPHWMLTHLGKIKFAELSAIRRS